ncbi:MAG: permease prefix domain 1-containing protein [Dermabacteraceae bacterium]
MTTELTERYLRAAVAGLPPATQEDVRAELTASIMDATEARIDQGGDPEAAERAVLTEMGDPAILSAEFRDRPLHLIGPRYYLTWWRLLKLLLAIVPAVAVVGVAIGETITGSPLGTIIGEALGVGLSTIAHVFFWVTIVFAVLERTGADTGLSWDVDQLPELESSTTSRVDAIASVVFVLIAAAAVLWDQLQGFFHVGGEWMSLLNPGLWPTWIIALLALLAMEAVLAVVVAVRRRWTTGLAVVNTALAALALSWALTLVGRSQLVNPDFVDVALRANGVDGDVLRVITVIFVVTVIGASAWDIVDGWRKASKDSKA